MLVLAIDEFVPGFLGVLPNHIVVLLIESHIILVNVSVELICAEHLGNLHELVVVVLALEEWLLLEDHTGEHAAEGPDVQRVVIGLQVNEQLWPLEVPGGNTDIVFLTWVVEFGKTPIDESQLAVGMIDHDVVGLHITVGDALRMAEVESTEDFENVVAYVEVIEILVQCTEVNITGVYILHDESRSLGHGIPHDIDQVDNVHAALQGLQDLDLTSDLGLLDWLEDLDDYALASGSVDTLVHL